VASDDISFSEDETTSSRPQGRPEVMRRVLEAARDLFTREDPNSVSIRAIADLAQVNHALVHRYFGTKDELLAMVLEQEAKHFAHVVEQTEGGPDAGRALFEAIMEREDFVIMLTRATLGGQSATRRSFEAGALRRLTAKVEHSAGSAEDALDPRYTVISYAALMLGWVVFRDFLTAATFIRPEEREAATDAVRSMLDRIIAPDQLSDGTG
jgi:AcrR family transcriptional regulator